MKRIAPAVIAIWCIAVLPLSASAASRNLCTPSEAQTFWRYFNNLWNAEVMITRPNAGCPQLISYVTRAEKLAGWLEAHPECLRPGVSKREIARARLALQRLTKATRAKCHK